MRMFAGIRNQLGITIRLERLRIVVWVIALGTVFVAIANSALTLYPDTASREQYAALNEVSPVHQAINGPGYALSTVGGIAIFEAGAYILIAVALMSVMATARLTRGAEEKGQSELTLSTATGSLAPLLATSVVTIATSIVIGFACALGMILLGLPSEGAWIFGLSVAAIGTFFTGLTSLLAQLFPTSAATIAVAGVFTAVWYALRAAGDLGNVEILTGMSPFGWVQFSAPFADNQRWWPLGFTITVGAVLGIIAMLVRRRRDLGAALWARSLGPASASPRIKGLLTATWKIDIKVVLGWAAGALFLGAMFGAVGEELSAMFAANSKISALLFGSESEINNEYLQLVLLLLAFVATGYAIAALHKLRTLERSGIGELTLSTAVSRTRWMLSALVPSLLGSAIILIAGAAALGGAFAVVSGDAMSFQRTVISALWHIPAMWLIAAITANLLGLVPRLLSIAWIIFGATVVIGMLGPALQLSDDVTRLSPFAHIPQLPDTEPQPGVWLLAAVSSGLLAAGIIGIRRRDLG